MCGIAGYFGDHPPDDKRVQECLRRMARRGPDAHGSILDKAPTGKYVLLLHSRLAIIDRHDRANQPMRRCNYVFTLNGQLFNYREIRADLRGEGAEFSTESDTEVLFEQLLRRGIDGLDACEGMWAFALYHQSGKLLLCRDRFGEKPLYIHQTGHGIYWGSEVKYIRALAGESIRPDLNHVKLYIAEGYKAVCGRSRTFWSGVQAIPAGSALTLGDASEPKLFRYWHPSYESDEGMSLESAIEGVKQRLTESVRIRLRADAPIAFCMSSGVDSSTLAAMARSELATEIHGFTVASRDPRYEEADAARRCAERMGIRHTTIACDASGFLDGIATLVQQHDAPVLTISYYLHWLVMRAMAEHGYRVAISGTGADELLTGYYEHHNLWLSENMDNAEYAGDLSAWATYIKPLIRNPALMDPSIYSKGRASQSALAARRLADSFLVDASCEQAMEGNYANSLLRNRMLNELFLQVVPAILHEDDLNAMYYSIENRSPFLDRRLAEFCFRIPSRHLIREAYTKYPLRAAMAGTVPDFVLWNRRKIGFNGSIRQFLNPLNPATMNTIMDSSEIFDIVRRDAVERLLKQESHTDDGNKLLFSIISAQAFLNAARQN